MKTYIVDTDVLLGFYDSLPMNVYETQWKMLEQYINDGRIVICQAFFEEVKKAEEFRNWLNKFKSLVVDCFQPKTLIEAKTIINNYPKLIDVSNPSDQADPYIIALAKINGYCVLTNEKYVENGKKTRIPFICKQLDVEYKNTRDFYIEEGWKF